MVASRVAKPRPPTLAEMIAAMLPHFNSNVSALAGYVGVSDSTLYDITRDPQHRVTSATYWAIWETYRALCLQPDDPPSNGDNPSRPAAIPSTAAKAAVPAAPPVREFWPEVQDRSLARLQREVGEWTDRTFGAEGDRDERARDCALGLAEEVGALCRAFLKQKQDSRGGYRGHEMEGRDAVANIAVFLAKLCHRKRWSLEEVVWDVWDSDSVRGEWATGRDER